MKKIDIILFITIIALVLVNIIWSTIITVNTWNVPMTRWDYMVAMKNPLLFVCIPMLIIYVIIVYRNRK